MRGERTLTVGIRADVSTRYRSALTTASASELRRFLDDPSPEVARTAIRRLAELEGPRAAPELRRRLLSADLALVGEVAKALRRIDDREALALSLAALRSERHAHRLAAARALGALGDATAVDALRRALTDEIAGVRIAALEALVQLGADGEAVEDCASLLADRDTQVRIVAVRAVARIAPPAGRWLAPAAEDPQRLVRCEVARHLGALAPGVATALLSDDDLRVREAAAQAAGTPHLAELAELLSGDPAADVRRAAARALGRLEDGRAPQALTAGLEDRDDVVRAAVLGALERCLTRAGATRLLCGELRSSRSERRRASLYALARVAGEETASRQEADSPARQGGAAPLEPEAADCVRALARDPHPEVRLALVHTAEALLGAPEALIGELAGDPDPAVRHAAENRLLRRGEAGRGGVPTHERDQRDGRELGDEGEGDDRPE